MASANLVDPNTGDLIPYSGNVTPYVRDSVAPLFSTSIGFNKGSYCYHDGKLYECTTAHLAGAWNPSHFTEVTVGGKLSEKQDITDNSLTTTDKTIPGAINELKSGLTINTASIQTTNAVGIAYRIGNIITININNGASFSADSGDLLFTLPEGYRPDGEISILNAIDGKQRIALYSDGNVSAREAFSNTYIRFCVTFIKA